MSDDTKTELPNIYWLGGSSGAGKTTIAQLIAENYGYELYSTDSASGDLVYAVQPQIVAG
jgi:adenylylsulfate kinase-like enzyme